MNYSLKERFKTLELDKIQSVGGMSVLPLVSVKTFEDVGSSEGFTFEGTDDYGTMNFKNDTDVIEIIPSNFMAITKQSAQDHAMATAGFLEPGDRESFNNACCIQSSQDGYISSEAESEFNILPLSLRTGLNESNRFSTGYDRIWNNIEKFNKDVTERSGSHLEFFFKEFSGELEEFVAEFEVVYDQVGAFIFFGKELMGVEIAPNVEYWKRIWKWLIRGCYGAEYFRQTMLGRDIVRIGLPDLKTAQSVDDITNAVNNYIISGTTELAKSIAGDWSFDSKLYRAQHGNKMVYFKGKELSGDVMFIEDDPVYVSLFSGYTHV